MNKSKKAVNKNSLKDFDFDQYLKLKKAERVKLLQQMVENLDPESRKNSSEGCCLMYCRTITLPEKLLNTIQADRIRKKVRLLKLLPESAK